MKPKTKPQKIKRSSVGGKTAILSELYIEQVEGKVKRSVLKIFSVQNSNEIYNDLRTENKTTAKQAKANRTDAVKNW